jgi:hypothetical protein
MDEYLFGVDYPDYRLVSRRYDGRGRMLQSYRYQQLQQSQQ